MLTSDEQNATGSHRAEKYDIGTTYISTPEPSSVVLAILGVVGIVAGIARRRCKQRR